MWPIPPLQNEIVSIVFSKNTIACCWIKKDDHIRFSVKAYKKYILSGLELEKNMIFNPTAMKKYITPFLQEHNLLHAFLLFSIDESILTEYFIAMPTSTPSITDFTKFRSNTLLWGYQYIYPNDEGSSIFYVYTIARATLLQYQLCAIANQYNLIAIIPKTIALLSFYQSIFNSAFRTSQLALDMMQNQNKVEDLISYDNVNRLVMMPKMIDLQEEYKYIAAACGLFSKEG